MRHKSRPLKRRKPRIEPRKRVLVICEGEKTEPSYFTGVKRLEQASTVDIEIDKAGGVPKTLVERAVAKKKDSKRAVSRDGDPNLLYDEIWCVFDVDEHPNLQDAKQQAKANGIELAISNPCFELWLHLHFKEQTASIERHRLQAACRECMPKYVKTVVFNDLKERIDDAIQRAIQLEKWQASRENIGENPSTSVHKLIQTIRTSSKGVRLREIDTAHLS